jgi:integrase
VPKLLAAACAEAKLEGVTAHVLRHTFVATAAGPGWFFSELTIAGLVGRRVAGVTARYAHMLDSAPVTAANKVAGEIAGAMG